MVVWIQNPFDNLPSEGYRKQRYWLMAEAFARAGHQVVLWTSDFSHAKKAVRVEGVEKVERVEGVEVRFIPTLPYKKNVSLARIRSHRACAREWLRLACGPSNSQTFKRSNPLLIISSCPTLSAAAAALKIGRAFGSKVVIDVQDAWPETFERLLPKGFRWLAKPFLFGLYRTARRIYREADVVTGVCERYRVLTGRPDYYLAHHGIELSSFAVQPSTSDLRPPIRLVYSGNLGKTYDLATVVRAVEENRDFELDVAGFGKFTCSCPRVRFHGLLSGQDLQTLLARCDIGVIPMSGESWVGIPNKLLDYSAAGLAIVSSLGGESSELLKRYRCGATYNVGDALSLAAAIRHVMTLVRGASQKMCAAEFDAKRIYDDYVKRVTA